MKTTDSGPADARAISRATKFSLAANYDPELIPALDAAIKLLDAPTGIPVGGAIVEAAGTGA